MSEFDKPMHEGTFGEEEIKLAIESRPCLSDCRRVTEHTDGSLNLGLVTVRYHSRRLVVDTHLLDIYTRINI